MANHPHPTHPLGDRGRVVHVLKSKKASGRCKWRKTPTLRVGLAPIDLERVIP